MNIRVLKRGLPASFLRTGSKLARDRRGSAAIEFGLIAIPFIAIIISIITVATHYYTLSVLEHGVVTAAREIRTGEAISKDLTVDQFKKMICDATGSLISCDGKLKVHFKSGTTFSDLVPPTSCVTNGSLTSGTGSSGETVGSYAGASSSTVSVQACYQWSLGSSLWTSLYGLVGLTVEGTDMVVLSAASVFRTEPY